MLSSELKKKIKKLLYLIFGQNFFIKYKIKKLNKNEIIILNLHRVNDHKNSSYTPLKEEIFHYLIKFCVKNFEITTFANARNVSVQKKPLLIFSFDDGYEDFYKNVMPILKKYNIKVNLNIIPSCIETGLAPINILFQDFIYQSPLNEIKKIYLGNMQFNFKSDLILFGNKISKFIKDKSYQDQIYISKEIEEKYFSRFKFYKTKIMSLNQLKECSLYHEIGIHSYYHSNMFYETDEFFIYDTNKCIDWFNKNLNFIPKIYAFPNNSYKESQINILKKMGFEHILLVNDNLSKIENKIYNRFNFHADSKIEAKCKAVGYRLR